MINYSIAMLGTPGQKDSPKKAYGVTQYSEKMTLEEFAQHISEHNDKYDEADIAAVLTKSVKCLREQLLAGKRVELGALGTFSLTMHGKGAETADKYSPDTCVTDLKVQWDRGKKFQNLKDDATYNLVLGRKAAAEALKKAKAEANAGGTDADTDADTTKKDDTTTDTTTDTTGAGGDTSGEDSAEG